MIEKLNDVYIKNIDRNGDVEVTGVRPPSNREIQIKINEIITTLNQLEDKIKYSIR